VKALELLRGQDLEVHLVVTKGAEKTCELETDYQLDEVMALADVVHPIGNLGASISSGSFKTLGMIVAPCSMRSLGSIAHCLTDNLLTRAADVVLKERRRLVLLARETPLNLGHIRNMQVVTEMGGIIFPPVPALYQRPQTPTKSSHIVSAARWICSISMLKTSRAGAKENCFIALNFGISMLIGPYVNGAAVVIGGLLGSLVGSRIPDRVKTALPLTFGLCSIGLGINLVIKVKFMPAVVLAMVLGAVIGEVFFLEKQIGKAAGTTRGLINRVFPPVQGLTHDEFTEKFVAILVLFCASGTGIFGAMHEGMTGDPSILYIKTVLDLFTAAIFATMLGFSVMTIGAPLIIVQVALATIAVLFCI
jgi:polyprenyl P-hydroxybenzoate/phenylacrylic acid decarboxylase-like protein